jgi:hypothetical protein
MNNFNRNSKIKLTDEEYEIIVKLYQIALEASSKSSLSSGGSSLSGDIQDKQKAWHNVQEYMKKLGEKYRFDPKRYYINRITKALEKHEF